MASTDFRVKNGLTVDGNTTVAGTSLSLGTSTSALTTATVGGAITGNILKVAGTTSGTANITTDVTTGIFNLVTGITTGTVNIATSGASITNIGGAASTLAVGTSGNSTLTVSGAATIKSPAVVGTDTNGNNLTIGSGLGTGAGYSGNLLFQTAPAGSSGTTANTYATRLVIDYLGQVAIGPLSGAAGRTLTINKAVTGSTTSYSVLSNGTIQSDVTTGYINYYSISITAAAAFTLSSSKNFSASQGVIGAGSAITTQYGFSAESTLIGATTNYSFYAGDTAAVTTGKTSYGFYSAINTASGGGTAWGIYANGTASNYIASKLGIANTSPVALLTLGTAGSTAGSLSLAGSTSGTITLQPAAAAGTTTITFPATAGTVITSGDSATVTNTMLAGSIANSKLSNSTISGISLGSNLNTLTISTGLTGTSYNGSTAVTIAVDSTTVALKADVHYVGTTSIALNRTSATQTLSGITGIDGGSSVSQALTIQSTTGNGTSDSILFKVGNNGATTAMNINTVGNIGIGTSPSYTLDVNGTTRSGKLLAGAITATSDTARIRTNGDIYMDAAVSTLAYNLYYDTGWNYRNNGPGFAWRSDGTSLMQLLSAVSGTGGTAASVSTPLTITTSGNVGIGTSSPARKLDIQQLSTDYQLRIGDTGNNYYDIGRNTSNGLFTFYGSQAVASGYVFSTVNGERMRIDSSGNVIIGSGEGGATPVGNTIRAPSGAGTNIAGANLTITSGNGTGTGGSGSIIFQTAPTGSTGSSANTMATVMTISPAGNVSMTGAISASNINRTYALPAVGAAASWIKLGTFTAGQGGHHCFIKVVTSVGYNAVTAQQNEVYIHFLTSNGVSVDANGFGGFTQFYITNTNGSSYNVKVVGNAAGVSATSYDIWFYQAGAYNGSGAFYTVEINNGNTWTNIATTGSDPGVASSTIGIGTNAMSMGSNILPAVTNTYNLGSTSLKWATMYGVASSANYADLAEKYTADEDYEPGTVLDFGGVNEVTISNTDMSRKIAGIVSTNPGYLMNAELESEFVVTLALTGRVPCKVQGAVRKGDMMVSASNGYARAEEDPKLGSVIGKALEDFNGITGVIEVVVGRL